MSGDFVPTQYLLFAGDTFYPEGGWDDFMGSYPTLESAKRIAICRGADWWHIVFGGVIVAEDTKSLLDRGKRRKYAP